MKEALDVLNMMVEVFVIKNYAIFGAIAQMRYTEAVATMDADILVSLPEDSGLDVLGPIYTFCKNKGFLPEGEAIRIGDWPVQFIPVFNPLSEYALDTAEEIELEGVQTRVASAVSLALMALQTGRIKDHLRIEALMEASAVTRDQISEQAGDFDLSEKWNRYQDRYL